MSNIKDLLKQYNEARQIAVIDLEAWPPATLPGAIMRKKDALRTIETTRVQYREYILNKALYILPSAVFGKQKKFSDVGFDIAGTLTVNVESLYEKLSEDIWRSMGDHGTFGVTQLGLLIRAITAVGKEVGQDALLPTPQLHEVMHCENRKQTISTVRDVVRRACGDALAVSYIHHAVVESGLARDMAEEVVPVVLIGTVPTERDELAKALGNAYVVPVKDPINGESVIKTFDIIKETLQNK